MKVSLTGRFTGGALKTPREGKDKCSACIALTDDAQVAILKEAVAKAKEEKWGSKPPKGVVDWTARVGDDEDYATYQKTFINPKGSIDRNTGEAKPIPTYTKTGNQLTEIPQEQVYPGCNVCASVDVFCYDGNPEKQIKPGVSVGIRGILFVSDNEPLGDVGVVADEFGSVESEVKSDSELFTDAEAEPVPVAA